MLIKEAQRELRIAFLGGFAGQLLSGLIWALSAAIGTWVSPGYGMVALFLVSAMLFPLTQLALRLMGRPAKLSPGNTLGQLATQIAFTVPVGFLLVAAATLYRESWFFPASMIVVGAHYLPFIFLYGMWQFGALAAALIFGGWGLAQFGPDTFSLGGWVSAVIFIAFAFWGRSVALKEENAGASKAAAAS